MSVATSSSRLTKSLVYGGLTVLLLACSTWAWFHFMEKRWVALPHFSPEAARNPMLASTMLLKRFHYDVKADSSLQSILRQPLPDGTLILAEGGGIFTPDQADELLAWVARGNTLITQPQWSSASAAADDDTEQTEPETANQTDAVLTDPIGEYLGVSLTFGDRDEDTEKESDDASTDTDPDLSSCKSKTPLPEEGDTEGAAAETDDTETENAAPSTEDAVEGDLTSAQRSSFIGSLYHRPLIASTDPIAEKDAPADQDAEEKKKILFDEIAFPGLPYALQVAREQVYLNSEDESFPPLLTDASGGSVRVYEEGEGHIVLLAKNYFANQQLAQRDHGELLLTLLKLHPDHKNVWIVTDLDMPTWYDALWQYYKWALIGAAVLLAIWLWRALQRFGPLLPEPSLARRAQLEHVDASGRWLWQVAGGRERLLHAARQDVEAALLRAAPELGKLNTDARIARIAALCDLQKEDVQLALVAAPARLPVEFTRQIQLLQKMRQHHDRYQ